MARSYAQVWEYVVVYRTDHDSNIVVPPTTVLAEGPDQVKAMAGVAAAATGVDLAFVHIIVRQFEPLYTGGYSNQVCVPTQAPGY